jgi:hypothetical protein
VTKEALWLEDVGGPFAGQECEPAWLLIEQSNQHFAVGRGGRGFPVEEEELVLRQSSEPIRPGLQVTAGWYEHQSPVGLQHA